MKLRANGGELSVLLKVNVLVYSCKSAIHTHKLAHLFVHSWFIDAVIFNWKAFCWCLEGFYTILC